MTPADKIAPLIAAGGDLERVSIVEAVTTDDGRGNKSRRMFNLQADLTRLETELARIKDVRLVIIDPITAYLGGVDTHRIRMCAACLAWSPKWPLGITLPSWRSLTGISRGSAPLLIA